jgi:hypothetical protein
MTLFPGESRFDVFGTAQQVGKKNEKSPQPSKSEAPSYLL